MNTIVHEISNSFKSENVSDIDELLLLVAFCFENYHGCPNEAWPDSIKSIEVSKDEAKLLKSDLVLFLRRDNNLNALGTAVWAFSKIVEKEDKVFLNNLLSDNLNGDGEALFQIMCALDNIGERIFEDGSASMFDFETNRVLAGQYLDRQAV